MSDPDHLDQYLSEMGVSYDLASLIYSHLIIADNRGRLTGDLAPCRRCPTAGSRATAHVRLPLAPQRSAAGWRTILARDVPASWEAVMNPHNNTFERDGCDRVRSIQVPDPTTVVVHPLSAIRRSYHAFSHSLGRAQKQCCPRISSYATANPTPESYLRSRSEPDHSASFPGRVATESSWRGSIGISKGVQSSRESKCGSSQTHRPPPSSCRRIRLTCPRRDNSPYSISTAR